MGFKAKIDRVFQWWQIFDYLFVAVLVAFFLAAALYGIYLRWLAAHDVGLQLGVLIVAVSGLIWLVARVARNHRRDPAE